MHVHAALMQQVQRAVAITDYGHLVTCPLQLTAQAAAAISAVFRQQHPELASRDPSTPARYRPDQPSGLRRQQHQTGGNADDQERRFGQDAGGRRNHREAEGARRRGYYSPRAAIAQSAAQTDPDIGEHPDLRRRSADTQQQGDTQRIGPDAEHPAQPAWPPAPQQVDHDPPGDQRSSLEDHHGSLDLPMIRPDGQNGYSGCEKDHGGDADNTGDRLGKFVPQPNATSRQRWRTPRRHSSQPVRAGPVPSIRADSNASHGEPSPTNKGSPGGNQSEDCGAQ